MIGALLLIDIQPFIPPFMIDLNYKEFGLGEPLIILHGLFGTLDNWQTIAKKLSENFTVFILDLRNHGRSPETDDEFDYQLLADDLAEFMQDHWIYEARIVGHSMGGKVAMQFALNHPDSVKKLVVIDIAPKLYPSGHEEIFDALLSLDLNALEDRKDAEKYLMEKLDNDFGTVQFLLKNLSRKADDEGGGFEWKMNLEVLHRDYGNILKAPEGDTFHRPTLFIRGGNSNYVKDSDMENIKNLFTEAELKTIEGAGHWVHADKPKELLEALKAFL